MAKNIWCLVAIASIGLTSSPVQAQDASVYSSLFAGVDRLVSAAHGPTRLGLSDLQQMLSLQGPGNKAYPDNSQMPGTVSPYQSLRFDRAVIHDVQINDLVVEVDRTARQQVQRLSFHFDPSACLDSAPIISKYQLDRDFGPDGTPGPSKLRYLRRIGNDQIWLSANAAAKGDAKACATDMGLIFDEPKNSPPS